MIMLTNLKSAFVSGLLMAVLGAATYFLQLGDVFKVDVHSLANIVALAFATAIVSFVKSSLTSDSGTFAGIQIR